ncbi:phage baseplate protein [Alistipes putredinis]|uniref:phage baseplate protein n=1 Tax=Alistipes putredinis TaxID=28117 RepID=UPI004027497E
MDKTFDEAIAGIRKAERGVEVREDIAQGMEYVKQYAEEVTGQQQAALQAAQTATGAASTATKKAAAAAESQNAAQTAAASASKDAQSASADAKSAGSSAASAKAEADRAAAIVSTDKTLSVEGAPADGKAVGDALKGIKLPIATATTLGGVKVGSGLTVDADGTLSADSALAAYPVGSIFQTVSTTSPAALFGGTWQEIAFNRVLMGAGNAYAAGTTVEAGLPNITGSLREANADSSPFRGSKASLKSSGALKFVEINTSWGGYRGDSGSTYDVYFDASRSNSIYGRSATVQPAAYYVHIWKRVA